MATLSIENLTGGSVGAAMPGLDASLPPAIGEARVAKEMQSQGLAAPDATSRDVTFGAMLENSLEKVNIAQHQSDDAIKELVAGRSKNIHETMLTIERADASLKMAMQVRNKILEAYREIMRMQV
jgi:flagellar hook-basal body complex protein FliE